jgi:glycosyltransferase involved in cell wall biosynthesis
MRLLLVNYEYPPLGGGAATATEAIARELAALDHKITILTAGFRDLPSQSDEDGVTIVRVTSLRKRADRSSVLEMFTFIMSSLLFLPSVISKYRPDGLIAFFSIPSGPIGAAARLFFRIPYVVSLRGGDVPGLTPEVTPLHRLLSPLRRYVLRHAIAVVANSSGLKKLSEKTDRGPVQVIPNGVDTEFFYPSPQKSGRGPLRILFVGRFHAQKNVSCLLEQCAHLPRQSFELHLAGDGPLRHALENLANQLGLSEAIQWHGWVSRADLRELYQRADCFVNPSFYEGLPNSVLEAMASGLAVIASRVPGNEDLVQHGETGLLFDLDAPSQLASHLRVLIDEPALAPRMGDAGRKVALKDYSWRKVAERYRALFSSHSSRTAESNAMSQPNSHLVS